MATLKKSLSINGKFKDVICNGTTFIDSETGEEIALAEILFKAYGDSPFDISTSYKEDNELE